MLRFAANLAMLFGEHALPDRFRVSRDFGFQLVEIPFPYELSPERIKQELDACDQTLWLIDLPVGDFAAGDRGHACNPDNQIAFRSSLDEALRYAEICGVGRLTCLVGKRLQKYNYDVQWRTLVENLHYASRRLAESGRTLLVEMLNTHESPGYFLPGSEAAAGLIREVDSGNCLMQYDLYHMQMMEGNLIQTIRRHLDLIGHIQIANVPGRHQPGVGEIDFGYIFSELESLNYQGVIGLEYIPEGSTAESLDWLKAFGATSTSPEY